MTILLKPYLECNLQCKYCYQIGKKTANYDINKVIESMTTVYTRSKTNITLHGGEPLCMGHADVEQLLSAIYILTDKSSIQTNGVLIDDEYIQMFKKYKTSVGFSLDGYYPENKLRANRETTDKILQNIDKLQDNNINCSIIITAGGHNTDTATSFENFKKFIIDMGKRGIYGRINPTYFNEANPKKLKDAYLSLAKFLTERGLAKHWSPFKDIINSLQDKSDVVCVFQECDPYNTKSATVILGDGSLSSCLRGDKYLQHPQIMNTRTEILNTTEYANGGCKDCKYFMKCYGGCSGCTPDWRTRDIFCPVYYALFEYYENLLVSMDICSEIIPTCSSKYSYGTQHSDGIEHMDGQTRHLDSGV